MSAVNQPIRLPATLRPVLLLVALPIVFFAAVVAADEPGTNVARGKSYVLSPKPTYRHCTDPGDKTQLTDGQLTEGYFWTQKGTVGWNRVSHATITVDLGSVEPISGVSFRTAAGAAGVCWPAAIHILVSDDGANYRDLGDLVLLDHRRAGPWPKDYAVRRLLTSDLRTRGRFVQFVVVPSPGTAYIFSDEVEVFRGPAELLQRDPGGTPVRNMKKRLMRLQIAGSLRRRYAADLAGVEQAVRDARGLEEPLRQQLSARVAKAGKTLGASKFPTDRPFRAVLPYNDAHGKLFRVQAALWKALGRAALSAWTPPTWDPLELFALPPGSSSGTIEVHTMRNEYRAAALNLANSTDRPLKVRLHVEGLPGSPTPGYLTVAEVPWTDTAQGKPVAAALPEVQADSGGWPITVLPGLVRQVWLTAHVTDLPAGEYSGQLVAEVQGIDPLRTAFQLHVYPLTLPKQTTLWLGGWSYTNGQGRYGITRQNRPEFLKHLQQRFVNAPWAGSSVMMSFKFADDGSVRLDTREFDDWIAQWPEAKTYLVFLGMGGLDRKTRDSFAGAKLGTAEFNRRVGKWISAWARHLQSKEISAGRLGLLLHDEPRGKADVKSIVAWFKAIHAAEPDVLIWNDPVYREPGKAPAELFEASDILCPNRPMWLRGGKPFAEFYLDQQSKGRTLQFYSCSGPARLLDPYSYYRLQAWHCRRIGATGSFFWAFGDNGYGSSWNEYLAKHGPYTPLFIDEQTVVAGKQMEAIRESVEDYEYFVMLRKAVDRARSAGRSDATVTEAETLLKTAAGEVLDAPDAAKLMWHDPKDRTKADDVRVRILKALSALQ